MKDQKTCPSSICIPGAYMLSVVDNSEEVIFNTVEVKIDKDMAQELHDEFGEPEKHFRFSNTCVESGCKQWKNGQCSVINLIIKTNEHQNIPEDLPDCLIRNTCRWFFQRGAEACKYCKYIVTDSLENQAQDQLNENQ